MRVYILFFLCITAIISVISFLDFYFSTHKNEISFLSSNNNSLEPSQETVQENINDVSQENNQNTVKDIDQALPTATALISTPVNPDTFSDAPSAVPTESKIPTTVILESPPASIKSNVFSEQIIEAFRAESVSGISANAPYNESFLFGIFPLNTEEHSLSLQVTSYNKVSASLSNVLPEEYLKVYEIDIHSLSKEKAYAQLKTQIESQLKNNIEANVVDVDQYGEKSFVIRLEPNQKTMYLVMDSGSRLLGIEYPLGENFSRHTIIDKVLINLF